MRIYDIIQKKRNGLSLTVQEIWYAVTKYTSGEIPDYQMSALLMAICICGMSAEETFALTDAMMHSGEIVDLGSIKGPMADKHSTGGVGDKTTLVVAPIVAACGCRVPKMSGRGLGHTGGTLDKLESIPGFRTSLTRNEFADTVASCGAAVISQTADIAPADKKIYALRDVTATVDSIPLIASSIMCKKLAAGAKNIVLDVTVGSGAFMKEVSAAKSLAETMISIGNAFNCKTTAVITNMDVPLGYAVGNSLEVIEAVSLLKGEKINDLKEVCIALASNMLSLALNIDLTSAEKISNDVLNSGKALAQFEKWITAQGGDLHFINDLSLLPAAPHKIEYCAMDTGYIAHMDAEIIGKASSALGAGRIHQDDKVDLSAGIVFKKKTGDYCNTGDIIAVLHTSDIDRVQAAKALLDSAVVFGVNPPTILPSIFDVIR